MSILMDSPLHNLALFLGNAGPVVVPGNTSPVITDFTSSEFNPHTGQSVTLTVTASDPDGDTLAYAYDFTVGSGTIIGSGASVSATVSNTGANTIRVTVIDGHGGSATQTLDLTGTNQAPTISSFTAAAGTIFNTGTDTKTVTVTASDPDSDTLTYSYSMISGLGSVSGTTATGTFTSGTAGGMSTVRVTVDDPYGGQATMDVQVRVCGWLQLASVGGPSKRDSHSAIYDDNGNMIIFGGNDGAIKNDVWRYNIAGQSWADVSPVLPPFPLVRDWHSAIYDPSGSGNMIVFGGYDHAGNGYNDVWQYDIASPAWTQLNPNPVPAWPAAPQKTFRRAAIYYPSGTGSMIIFGGVEFGGGYKNDVWRYDIAGQSWTMLASAGPSARIDAGGIYHPSGAGYMVIFGGDDGVQKNDVWSYDIANETWASLTSVGGPSARWGHSVIYYPSGTGYMIIFGGNDGVMKNDVWSYDIVNETWASLGSFNPPTERNYHKAIYDGSGNMIVFGGTTDTGDKNDVWMYVLP